MNYPTRTTAAPVLPMVVSPQVRQELERSLFRAYGTSQAFERAMEDISDVFSYAFFKSVQSVTAASMLRQVAVAQGVMTPEIDRQLAEMTEAYLRDMNTARHAATHHLLQIANDVANGSMQADSLQARLTRLLQG